ncbi:MAG: hypothetical protein HN411_02925 [Waddliaceae bacterium]|nr:hypothetical protein [Waddliaceae bacterium]MBT3578633.1 hypothetical protein [Waddliaceae bacterium]MBT4445352.1 hypothetical protein [Waddliaceae bacterium]MBT6928380.1 hypothetical protein [Waddliaceae bacterium]MBT7265066.1 hypothetical protein [Waddliaceae bacterium]
MEIQPKAATFDQGHALQEGAPAADRQEQGVNFSSASRETIAAIRLLTGDFFSLRLKKEEEEEEEEEVKILVGLCKKQPPANTDHLRATVIPRGNVSKCLKPRTPFKVDSSFYRKQAQRKDEKASKKKRGSSRDVSSIENKRPRSLTDSSQ